MLPQGHTAYPKSKEKMENGELEATVADITEQCKWYGQTKTNRRRPTQY